MIKSREGLRLSEKIHQEVISVQQEDEEIKINSAADNALCNRIDWFLLFPVNWLLLLSLSVSMTHTHCHTQTAKTVTHYLTLLSRSVYSLPALCSFLWPLKQIYRLRSRKQHWRKVSKGISGEKESQPTFMSVSRSKPEIQAEDTGKYSYVSHTWSAFTEASTGKRDKKTERGNNTRKEQ